MGIPLLPCWQDKKQVFILIYILTLLIFKDSVYYNSTIHLLKWTEEALLTHNWPGPLSYNDYSVLPSRPGSLRKINLPFLVLCMLRLVQFSVNFNILHCIYLLMHLCTNFLWYEIPLELAFCMIIPFQSMEFNRDGYMSVILKQWKPDE